METRDRVLHHLKREGPASVPELAAALSLSANATRHHLHRLEREGVVRVEVARAGGVGRPARRYALTPAAEDAFPKRYPQLLAALLAAAEQRGVLDALLQDVVAELAAPVREALAPLAPHERLLGLLRAVRYGDMLPSLATDPEGWRLVAHNCVYRDAGCQSAAVCELLPRLVTAATGLPAERTACQRDGRASCTFRGGWFAARDG